MGIHVRCGKSTSRQPPLRMAAGEPVVYATMRSPVDDDASAFKSQP